MLITFESKKNQTNQLERRYLEIKKLGVTYFEFKMQQAMYA